MKPTPEDLQPSGQLRRQKYLEKLYELDGRGDKNHPKHGTYTGLYQQRRRDLLDSFVDKLVREDMNHVLYGLEKTLLKDK